jgi:hypothetical protein
MVHKVHQLCEELWAVIKRHKYENDTYNYHVIASLEDIKFEILKQAFDAEEENEADIQYR